MWPPNWKRENNCGTIWYETRFKQLWQIVALVDWFVMHLYVESMLIRTIPTKAFVSISVYTKSLEKVNWIPI